MDFIENEDLRQLKSNIVKWYDFKYNSNILLIGENTEEIKDELSLKMHQIIVKSNLAENGDIIADKKFDYIIIKDNLAELSNAKKHLKDDGTILVMLNNRFSIENFAGADNFKSIYEENSKFFSRKQIEDFLKYEGFSNYKFFYPLPNYEIANVIFSDDYLPEYNDTKLLYNNIYSRSSAIVFDEARSLKQLTKNGEFKFFVNSYFIEINPKTKVKFASFNNIRKEEFRLCTKIYDDYVEKIETNSKSKIHIEKMKQNIDDLKNHGIEILDKAQNGKIISKYVETKSLYQTLLELINKNKTEEFYKLIENWFEFIKKKFENDKVLDNSSELMIVKNAYIDLVFENTFIANDKFIFFDQEWNFPNLPMEFILYRAINNMYIYNQDIEAKFPKEDLYKKFNLLDYINLFQEKEKIIQENISDSNIIIAFEESRKSQKLLQKIDELNSKDKNLNELIKEFEDLKIDKDNLIARNKLLNIEEKKKEKYIEELTNENGELLSRKGLLENEEKKKEEYIEKLTNEIGQKSNLINELENKKQDLENINMQKEEIINELNKTINQLNEIIKVKDNQIQTFENMKLVKLTKKLRGMKD